MTRVKLDTVEMDTSIQCRAHIDMAVVNEYAEAISNGAKMPDVVLFGTESKSWIGDGWHRIMANEQIGYIEVDADLRQGGRVDALKFALGVNAAHGLRRTNADKRRCVELALKEFGGMSDNAVANMCGVGDGLVATLRPVKQVPDSGTSKRTGSDGKQYPAKRNKTNDVRENRAVSVVSCEDEPTESATITEAPPARELIQQSNGMQFARMAVMDLERITTDDPERQEAFNFVKGWIDEHE